MKIQVKNYTLHSDGLCEDAPVDMSEEIWKPAPGYEERYEISNMGRIRNRSGHVLKPQDNGLGYRKVRLSTGNGRKGEKREYIHRLVAKAFVPNPRGVECVNHLDENPSNNRADNLEWVTFKENLAYGDAPRKSLGALERYRASHPNHLCNAVRCIETGTIYESMTLAGILHGTTGTNIGKTIKGERHTAGGYHWEYV